MKHGRGKIKWKKVRSYTVTPDVIIQAQTQQDIRALEIIFKSFEGLIFKLCGKIHQQYPAIEMEDLVQTAKERVLICLGSYKPYENKFTFPNYIKTAVYFSLRRFAKKQLGIREKVTTTNVKKCDLRTHDGRRLKYYRDCEEELNKPQCISLDNACSTEKDPIDINPSVC